jgi:hypothetical protein
MGREKCKWESCVLCAEGGFCLSAAWLYVFINFPTLVLCRFRLTLLLLLLFLVYLLCPPSRSDGTILCFLFSCAPQLCWCLGKLSSRYSSNVYGFLTEHVENIINFISLRFSYHFAAHFSSPAFPLIRTKTSPFDSQKMKENFSIF